MNENKPLLYKVEEAAKKLGISKTTLYSMAREKRIPSVKIGGRVLIPVAGLEEWISRNTEETEGDA
jgi:excisionase family DNA binding protein